MASAKKKQKKKARTSILSWRQQKCLFLNIEWESSAPPPLAHGQLDLRWLEKYQKIGSKSLAKQGSQSLKIVGNVSYAKYNSSRLEIIKL